MDTAISTTTTQSKSRRALLAGALGGLGAWAASAVGRASRVHAADGETVLVGGEYQSSSVTSISNLANNGIVLRGVSSSGTGVVGASTSFYGVQAISNTGSGLGAFTSTGVGAYGASSSHRGVWGFSDTGTGLFGSCGTGLALHAEGRIKFSTSGTATIAAGSTSKTVNPGVNVTSGSFVLLTPKANIGSRALWFTINPTANTFRIRMSSPRSSTTRVAWLLLG
jgi:hypothetical protein